MKPLLCPVCGKADKFLQINTQIEYHTVLGANEDGTVVIEDVPRTDFTQVKSHFYCDACYTSFKNVNQKLVEETRRRLPLDLD